VAEDAAACFGEDGWRVTCRKIIYHLSLDIFHLLIWKEKPGRLRDPANKQMTNVQ
jgi:hypothetical protein